MKRICLVIGFCALLLVQWSCGGLEKAGKSLAKGVSSETKAMGANLVSGATEKLTDSATKVRLRTMLDTLLATLDSGVNKSVSRVRDSVFNERLKLFVRELIEDATGKKLRNNADALVATLLGDKTKTQLRIMIAELKGALFNEDTDKKLALLRDNLLGAELRSKLGDARDELFNDKTKLAISKIVDTAMGTIARRLKEDITPQIQENASFLQKHAGKLLTTLGVISLAIIGLVWRNRQKYLKLVTMLTAQINSVKDKDQNTYNELADKIKDKAVHSGLEPMLRKLLKENGLLKDKV